MLYFQKPDIGVIETEILSGDLMNNFRLINIVIERVEICSFKKEKYS